MNLLVLHLVLHQKVKHDHITMLKHHHILAS
nr:MAG TPA: hypothetical protein [Bacteriophage sp.]